MRLLFQSKGIREELTDIQLILGSIEGHYFKMNNKQHGYKSLCIQNLPQTLLTIWEIKLL